MRHVLTNAELAAIHDARVGLVFSAYTTGPTAAQYNLLHSAGCSSVAMMLRRSDPDEAPSIAKIYFDSLAEAQVWMLRYRGEEHIAWTAHRCRTESAVADGPQVDYRAAAQSQISQSVDDPFREAKVEVLLYAYLRQSRYTVQEKVPVPSGIVDAIATRDGERIVIEVKGEDSGGYTSAQMNFQVAVGQIASRMNDPAARYAIAFPMTANYAKVLRTFRGSLAFERLCIAFYVVERSGEVREIEPRLIGAWIDSISHS